MGHVLIDVSKKKIFSGFARALGGNNEENMKLLMQRWDDSKEKMPLNALLGRGMISPCFFYRTMCSVLGLPQAMLTYSEFCAAFNSGFHEHKEMTGELNTLKSKFEMMLMITNINDIHFRYLTNEMRHIFTPFDNIIASHLVGLRKPEREIYELAKALLEKKGINPQTEAIFVDDVLDNIMAARRAGIGHTYWFRPENGVELNVKRLKQYISNVGEVTLD